MGSAVLLAALLASPCVMAWGPRAQRGITMTAMQMLRREMPNAFKAKEGNYEADLLRGSNDGPQVLRASEGLTGPNAIINLIDTEVLLLRKAREYGTGSYFAYRMGILASMMSDMVLPFALDPSPQAQRLLHLIEADIDQNAKQFSFEPQQEQLHYVRDPNMYLKKRRVLVENAETLIRDDYIRGVGYDGYLRSGAEAFFQEAIQSTADGWYTVLRPQPAANDIPPSQEALTWYLADAIDYLLTIKGNKAEADRAYKHFADVNRSNLLAYEQVGDSYYNYGDKDRGVREWQIALNQSGPRRQRVLQKLATHHLSEGKNLLQEVDSPDAPQNVLDKALIELQMAFDYDTENSETERLIRQTREAISEREEQRQLASEMVAKAQAVMEEADQSKERGAYDDAIARYRKAIIIFEGVDDRFEDYAKAARTGIDEAEMAIDDMVRDLIEQAHDKMDRAEKLKEDADFDQAVQVLKSVPDTLNMLPADMEKETRAELAKEVEARIVETENQKQRYEETEKQKAEMARQRIQQQGQGGAAAGAAARPGAGQAGASPMGGPGRR